MDRVDTTATVWLGLTIGCARCHDHKYDPITQKEFYRFFAYFNNVSDRGRYFKYGTTPPIVRAPTREQRAELAELDNKIAVAARELESLEGAIGEGMRSWARKAKSQSLDWSFDERLASVRSFDEGAAEGKVGRAAVFAADQVTGARRPR